MDAETFWHIIGKYNSRTWIIQIGLMVLLILLTRWGLTGIKSFFFNALEDIILLICGLYCGYYFGNYKTENRV